MALPRKLVNALRAGTYQPSNASKRAREAATRLREQQRISEAPTQPRDTFRSVKNRMTRRKHAVFYNPGERYSKYNPTESMRAVEGSDEYEAMRDALGVSDSQMRYLAHMASLAYNAQRNHGDAGDLEIYLKYDFLFYHL